MILEVCWDGLWTLSFGLSQFHGHGSWLVCEVALSSVHINTDPLLAKASCTRMKKPSLQVSMIDGHIACTIKIYTESRRSEQFHQSDTENHKRTRKLSMLCVESSGTLHIVAISSIDAYAR